MLIYRYDYQSIQTKLIEIASNTPYWSEYRQTALGSLIIDLIASGSEEIGYYLERRSQESYIDTAKLSSSIKNIATNLGYTPERKTSATGRMTIELEKSYNTELIIPKGSSWKINDTIYVTNTESIIIPKNTKIYTFDIMQGRFIIEELRLEQQIDYAVIPSDEISTVLGKQVQFNNIANNFCNLYIEVPVKNQTKKMTLTDYIFSSFKDINSMVDPNVYYLQRYYFEKLLFFFDNEGFTKNPYNYNRGENDEINTLIFEYVVTDGDEGNIVLYKDTTVKFENSVLDYSTNENIDSAYEFRLAKALLGGTQEESIQKVKTYAPFIYSTGKNAVSVLDYEYWVKKYPNSLKAVAFAEEDMTPPNLEWANKVGISATTYGIGEYGQIVLKEMTDEDITNILNYFENKRMAHITVKFVKPEIIKIKLNIGIYIDKNYNMSASEVLHNVDKELMTAFSGSYFDFPKKDYSKIGNSRNTVTIYKSTFYDYIQSIKGVEGLELEWSINNEILEDYIFEYSKPTQIAVLDSCVYNILSEDNTESSYRYDVDMENIELENVTLTGATLQKIEELTEKELISSKVITAKIIKGYIPKTNEEVTGGYIIAGDIAGGKLTAGSISGGSIKDDMQLNVNVVNGKITNTTGVALTIKNGIYKIKDTPIIEDKPVNPKTFTCIIDLSGFTNSLIMNWNKIESNTGYKIESNYNGIQEGNNELFETIVTIEDNVNQYIYPNAGEKYALYRIYGIKDGLISTEYTEFDYNEEVNKLPDVTGELLVEEYTNDYGERKIKFVFDYYALNTEYLVKSKDENEDYVEVLRIPQIESGEVQEGKVIFKSDLDYNLYNTYRIYGIRNEKISSNYIEFNYVRIFNFPVNVDVFIYDKQEGTMVKENNNINDNQTNLVCTYKNIVISEPLEYLNTGTTDKWISNIYYYIMITEDVGVYDEIEANQILQDWINQNANGV